MDIKKIIDDYFDLHSGEMIDAVCRMVCIDSVRGEPEPGMPFGKGPANALREALSIAQEIGFSTTNYENYIGAVDFNDSETQLDILAHLDVVPASDDWTITQPFKPVVRDGRIYGRGSSDDKGPAIAALYAMKALKDLGVPLKKNVRLLLGTDEESGCRDTEYYYAHHPEAPMTFSPDAYYPVINIEKGGLHASFCSKWKETSDLPRVSVLKAGERGNIIPETAFAVVLGITVEQVLKYAAAAEESTGVRFFVLKTENGVEITATGVSSHASLPEDGNNALTAMMDLVTSLPCAESRAWATLRKLHSLFPYGDVYGKASGVAMSDAESGALTLSLTVLDYHEGGVFGKLDCRTPLRATKENVLDVLCDRLTKAGVSPEVGMYPPHYIAPDHPLVLELMKCYRQYTGRNDKPIAIGGGSYVHGFKNGVAFGCSMPGTNNHMHGADEFAVVDELIVSAKMFAQAIVDLCG